MQLASFAYSNSNGVLSRIHCIPFSGWPLMFLFLGVILAVRGLANLADLRAELLLDRTRKPSVDCIVNSTIIEDGPLIQWKHCAQEKISVPKNPVFYS